MSGLMAVTAVRKAGLLDAASFHLLFEVKVFF